MIGLGAAFVVVSAAMAGFFGVATSFADALSRVLPGVPHGTPRWVGRMGGTDAWQHIVQPVLEMPCWAPFLALAGLFVLVGALRRL